jgi:FkbM family methyltransferase
MNKLRKGIGVTNAIAFGMRNGIRSQPLVLIDIGGRNGLSRPWQILYKAGLVAPVFFEPEPKAATALEASYKSSTVINDAVWSDKTRKTLHVTAQPGCSSILAPDPDERMPEAIKLMMHVEKLVDVDLIRPDIALTKLGIIPDVVKLDIQGAELEALKGFGKLLQSVSCVEMEVSFMKGYGEQPLFGELYDFMVDSGFGLFDLKVFGVAGTRNGTQANAFFCRRDLKSPRQSVVETMFRYASDFSIWP